MEHVDTLGKMPFNDLWNTCCYVRNSAEIGGGAYFCLSDRLPKTQGLKVLGSSLSMFKREDYAAMANYIDSFFFFFS